jgi:hypothetical protein
MDLSLLTDLIPSSLFTLAMGVLTCFLGYRLRKIWASLAGLVFGFSFGSRLAANFWDASHAALVGLGVGLAALVLCIWLYDAGIFLLCGGCGAVFVCALFSNYTQVFYLILAVGVGSFLLIGLLALRFAKTMLILCTGFSGAGSIISSLVALGIPYLSDTGLTGVICILVCAVAGIVVQFSTAHGR